MVKRRFVANAAWPIADCANVCRFGGHWSVLRYTQRPTRHTSTNMACRVYRRWPTCAAPETTDPVVGSGDDPHASLLARRVIRLFDRPDATADVCGLNWARSATAKCSYFLLGTLICGLTRLTWMPTACRPKYFVVVTNLAANRIRDLIAEASAGSIFTISIS